jgi:TPR repeat protein
MKHISIIFQQRYLACLTAFLLIGAICSRATDSTSNSTPVSSTNQAMTLKAVTAKWQDADPNTLNIAATNGDVTAQTYLGYQDIISDDPDLQKQGVYWCRLAANQGFPLAEDFLGWAYGNGKGVDQDYDLAEKWMHRSVDHGLLAAEYDLGHLLENEFNTSGQQVGNFVVAAEWYRKAADQGHVKAMFALAELYNGGKLGDDQRSNCIPWYLKAAALGNVDAQAEVGELATYYPNSELLKKVDVVANLQQSAENGNAEAQFQLAKRYQTGDGVPKDATQAFQWMQKAAQNGVENSEAGEAMYQLGLMYEKGDGTAQDEAQAHTFFLDAADLYAIPEVTYRVGQMYEKGDGVPQDDRKAAEYYASEFHNPVDTNTPGIVHPEKYANGVINYATPSDAGVESLLNLWAAGRGFPAVKDQQIPGYKEPAALMQYFAGFIKTAKTQYYVGEIYYQGKLVPKDIATAADWFTKAATQGSPEAMNRIGEMWATGLNGSPDPKEAANWYQKAAALGLAESQYNLGLCYAEGNGVSTDPVEAWKWLQSAAKQGFPKAAADRDKIQVGMTTDQINAAHALSDQIDITPK